MLKHGCVLTSYGSEEKQRLSHYKFYSICHIWLKVVDTTAWNFDFLEKKCISSCDILLLTIIEHNSMKK